MQLNFNDLQGDRCWTQTFAQSHSALLLWVLIVLVRNGNSVTGKTTVFHHQNVKYIFWILMEICFINPIICHVHISHPFPQEVSSVTLLGMLPHKTYCVLLLDSTDQSANKVWFCRPYIHVWRDYSLCTKRSKSTTFPKRKNSNMHRAHKNIN